MPVFRTQSKAQQHEYQGQNQSHNDKLGSSNMQDPILSAVNEAQPFEEANQAQFARKHSYLSQESGELKDIFGNRIDQADVSNPTRSRNERPLDTIRAFEYAITGDMSFREQLESNRLGWGFHEDFSYQNLTPHVPHSHDHGYSRPVVSFSGANQSVYQTQNYSASSLKPETKRKKRFFGRSK